MTDSLQYAAGDVLAGRFRLDECVGQGGMGSVWRAEHLTLRSSVAIKLLHPSVAADEDAAARFLREAQAAAALRSPNVVQILDYGMEGDVPFIAMEYLDGESLRQRLDRVGILPLEEMVRVVSVVLRAVGRAHKRGIVHRDLKPANIQLVPDEDDGPELVKVLDFGIAKIVDNHALDGGANTSTGALLGTPYYMSPEQLRGLPIDVTTDLWAVGVIAYQCLVGERPFDGSTVGDLVLKICTDDPPVPSEVGDAPVSFDAWFHRAVARDRKVRFESAAEMGKALRELAIEELPAASRHHLELLDASIGRAELEPDSRNQPSSRPISTIGTDAAHEATLASGDTPYEALSARATGTHEQGLDSTSLAQSSTVPPRTAASASRGWWVAGAAVAVAVAGGIVATRTPPSASTPSAPASVAAAAEPGPPLAAPSASAPEVPPTAPSGSAQTAPGAPAAETSSAVSAPSTAPANRSAAPARPVPYPPPAAPPPPPSNINFGF